MRPSLDILKSLGGIRFAFFPILLLASCHSSIQQNLGEREPSNRVEQDNQVSPEDADIRILFLGNSHTYMHNLPMVVGALIDSDENADRAFVAFVAYPNAFLVDHLDARKSMDAIERMKWDVVVLQGQKYSTSGRFTYPHDAAIEITKRVQDQGGRVVMFPEWGQRGSDDEGQRVHDLHTKIAEETEATVAPVGLAWDAVLEERPRSGLHATDGNHCSQKGAYLTACVIYSTVTGRSAEGLTETGRLRMTRTERSRFQTAAWKVVEEHVEFGDDE